MSVVLIKPKARLREKISEEALTNWYNLLWHHRIHGKFPDLDTLMIQNKLFHLLHTCFRDDVPILLGAFRVWALATVSGVAQVDFENAVNDNDIAHLIAGPVPISLIPPTWRLDACMDNGRDWENFVELNELGMQLLFGRWHLLQLDKLYSNHEIINEGEEDIEDNSLLSDTDVTLLCRILGHVEIPAAVIYGSPSDANVYGLIKLSGLDFQGQNLAAGRLFDRLPSEFPKSLVGQYIKLAKTFQIAFLFGDAILGHEGKGLWLQYDKCRKLAAIVDGTHVLIITVASKISKIKDYLRIVN